MTAGRDQTVELLHALGHIYARHSQPKRGLVLLLIAARLAPNDEGVLRTLAEAFLRSRSPQAAMEVIERLPVAWWREPARARSAAQSRLAARRQ